MTDPLLSPVAVRLRKMERLIRRGGATAEQMMAATGVSIATLKRDLDLLRWDLGAQIVYCPLTHNYELRNTDWPGVVPRVHAMLMAV